MEKKRDRLEVIRDILLVIQSGGGKIKPTKILYRSNLSHGMMKDYIKDILSMGLAKETHSKEGRTYSITEKGLKYNLSSCHARDLTCIKSAWALFSRFQFGLLAEYL